jgi:hypothetical protein
MAEPAVAVLRVGARRSETLDEESALMLAAKFSLAASLYGYFAQLSGLEAKQYREIKHHRPTPRRNTSERFGRPGIPLQTVGVFAYRDSRQCC